MKNITIIKGDDTNTLSQFLKIVLSINTLINIDEFTGEFVLGQIKRKFLAEEILSKELNIEFTSEETSLLNLGPIWGEFKLFSPDNKVATIISNIPFFVASGQFANPNTSGGNTINISVELAAENTIEINFNISTGGDEGTSDYNLLINRPEINSVKLEGNRTLSELGISSEINSAKLEAIRSSNEFTLQKINEIQLLLIVMYLPLQPIVGKLYGIVQQGQTLEGKTIILLYTWSGREWFVVGVQEIELDFSIFAKTADVNNIIDSIYTQTVVVPLGNNGDVSC